MLVSILIECVLTNYQALLFFVMFLVRHPFGENIVEERIDLKLTDDEKAFQSNDGCIYIINKETNRIYLSYLNGTGRTYLLPLLEDKDITVFPWQGACLQTQHGTMFFWKNKTSFHDVWRTFDFHVHDVEGIVMINLGKTHILLKNGTVVTIKIMTYIGNQKVEVLRYYHPFRKLLRGEFYASRDRPSGRVLFHNAVTNKSTCFNSVRQIGCVTIHNEPDDNLFFVPAICLFGLILDHRKGRNVHVKHGTKADCLISILKNLPLELIFNVLSKCYGIKEYHLSDAMIDRLNKMCISEKLL